MTVKYGWSPEVYISKVEGNSDARFKDYMQAEIRYISNIPRIVTKTIVDLGAGYGRVEGVLSGIAREVKAIEIDKVMLKALRDRTKNFDNVRVISGDVNSLSSFVTGTDLVLISLQNSLGTWIGDRDIAIKQIRKVL
ncbi:MAG: class I SAM-dependent methyltransferase, partial [Candidatus Micrarchaeota archaeon]|nr:class I SAM-dependent methyltransferase [Candidatus Micrarchaeota archaeon]